MEDCLTEAKQVTEYSLNITAVRKALKAARENLHEVGFENDMIRLQTWISICEDLNVEDYEEKEFETLKGDVNGININSLGTRSAINQKFDLLFNDYNIFNNLYNFNFLIFNFFYLFACLLLQSSIKLL